MGHAGVIGALCVRITDIPFERVNATTYPNQHGIPIVVMEDAMAKCK
jgi:hypothetical protein